VEKIISALPIQKNCRVKSSRQFFFAEESRSGVPVAQNRITREVQQQLSIHIKE